MLGHPQSTSVDRFRAVRSAGSLARWLRLLVVLSIGVGGMPTLHASPPVVRRSNRPLAVRDYLPCPTGACNTVVAPGGRAASEEDAEPRPVPQANPAPAARPATPRELPHEDEAPAVEPLPPSVRRTPSPPAARPSEAKQPRPRPQLQMPTMPEPTSDRVPHPSDGLAGNRQVALTPFPNLDIESGPLAKDQVPWNRPAARSATPITSTIIDIGRTASYRTLIGGYQSIGSFPSNALADGTPDYAGPQRTDDSVAWYHHLGLAVPFWREMGIGLELGGVVEPTTFPTVNLGGTAGFFHRAVWPARPDAPTPPLRQRISWSSAFDAWYDSQLGVTVGQHRSQMGLALAPDREIGLWWTMPLQDAEATQGYKFDLSVQPMAQFALYHRERHWDALDLTLFVGATENPGGIQLGTFAEYRFADRGSWLFHAFGNTGEEPSYMVQVGVRLDLLPTERAALVAENLTQRYAPYARPLDHATMQLRKQPL